MELAVRRGPDFDERHVWISVGWGIWGALFIACGFTPHTGRPYLLALVMIALLFTLPIYLPRLACRNLPSEPTPGDREVNSPSNGLLIVVLSLGIIFWVSRMSPAPHNMVLALIFLMVALWSLFASWGRRWWRGLLAFAFAFGAAGFAMPFLPKNCVGLTIGLAMIVGGFGGAAILHFQLKNYANGKTAD